MPDTDSLKVIMADEDFRSGLYGSGKDGILPGRKWSCPEDEMIASYVDGALGDARKAWVEFHLASCRRCRLLVAGVIQAQRETDLPLPPAELRWKTIGSAELRTAPKRGVWVPAGALAAVAMLTLFAVVLHKSEQLIIQSPPSPSAPLIAKSEPAVAPRTPVREIERKRKSGDPVPSILSPQPDSVVTGQRLEFVWKPIPHSRYYEVRVVTKDGDLIWEAQTEKSDLQAPSDVRVRSGSYFVWVTAYLANGQVAKSLPIKFVVKR